MKIFPKQRAMIEADPMYPMAVQALAASTIADFARVFGSPYEFEEKAIGFCGGCRTTLHPFSSVRLNECYEGSRAFGESWAGAVMLAQEDSLWCLPARRSRTDH